MWPFPRKMSKASFQDHRAVWIKGYRFFIRRINPLTDFPAEKMPNIFTEIYSQRTQKMMETPTVAMLQRAQDDMKMIVKAGLVAPKLGEEITIDDLFSNPDLGVKLYEEVLIHSLNRFSGLKGVFFSLRIKRLASTLSRQSMASAPST